MLQKKNAHKLIRKRPTQKKGKRFKRVVDVKGLEAARKHEKKFHSTHNCIIPLIFIELL